MSVGQLSVTGTDGAMVSILLLTPSLSDPWDGELVGQTHLIIISLDGAHVTSSSQRFNMILMILSPLFPFSFAKFLLVRDHVMDVRRVMRVTVIAR